MFFDVQMPEVSGFDVLRALSPAQWPAVIFVTAHDQAVQPAMRRDHVILLKNGKELSLTRGVREIPQRLEFQ